MKAETFDIYLKYYNVQNVQLYFYTLYPVDLCH